MRRSTRNLSTDERETRSTPLIEQKDTDAVIRGSTLDQWSATRDACTSSLTPADGHERMVPDLLAREHDCCPFADIVIRPDSNGLTVEIGVPEGAKGVLDGFAFIAETAAPGAAR